MCECLQMRVRPHVGRVRLYINLIFRHVFANKHFRNRLKGRGVAFNKEVGEGMSIHNLH